MTDKPWWLWKGAAVRDTDICNTSVGKLYGFLSAGKAKVVWTADGPIRYRWPDSLIPIENPAVMLAPEWATHVHISAGSARVLYVDKNDNDFEPGPTDFTWPQCPDHLKGHIWPLPRRGND